MKLETKKENARERKEKFKTGGGPPVTSTNSLADSLLENQQPLTGVLDDNHLDSGKLQAEMQSKCVNVLFAFILN